MIEIVKQISVDVAKDNVFQSIVAKQYDSKSRFLKVRLTNEGSPITVHPTSVVTINALREDGEALVVGGTVDENDGTVKVPITYQMLELDGQVKCDISVVNQEQRKLSSTTFTIRVEPAVCNSSEIVEDDQYDVLTDLILQVKELKEATEDVLSAANNDYSNALKGSASGEAIGMYDVSPIEHEMGVKARGKNLLDINKWASIGSLNATVQGDSIIIEPKESLYGVQFLNDNLHLEVGKTYTASVGSVTDYAVGAWGWRFAYADGTYSGNSYSTTYTFTLDKEITAILFYLGAPYEGNREITISNIQIEKGTTATSYAPYIPDISAVKVMKLGKNLAYPYSSTVSNGITFTKEDDGSVYIKGKATGFISYSFAIPSESILRENTTYRVSVSCSGTLPCDASPVFAFVEDGKQKWQQTVIWNKNCSNPLFYIQFYEGDEVDAHYYFQLEIGSTKTEYEPYIQPTEYTPDADGVVSGVTSLSPSTTLMTDTDGALIDATYNKDINKAFDELKNAILSLGGNV